MYKDKNKQRKAQRDWVRQKRAEQGSTKQRPAKLAPIPKECITGSTEGATKQSVTGQGVTVALYQHSEDVVKPKRGKDIKCFADLPPDVQQTISKMSLVDGKIDQFDKAKRTTAAIKYQHLFPESYECGHMEITRAEAVCIGKPGDADYNGVCTEAWRAERGR